MSIPSHHPGSEDALIDSLSPRERQLLEMATNGLTDAAIANDLGISLPTVSTYWGRIRIKFGPLGRTEIVARHLRALMNRASAELQASETRLRTVLEANPVGIFLTDAHGRPVYMNSAYVAIAGTDEATLTEDGFSALVFPEDRPRAEESRAREPEERPTEGEGYVSEHRWDRADGTSVWVRLRSEEWHHGGAIAGRVGVVEDVTIQHKARERQHEAEERYRVLFSLAPDAIVSVGEDLAIVDFNAAAERMFGYAVTDIVGKPLAVLLPDRFHGDLQRHAAAFGRDAVDATMPMAACGNVRGVRNGGDEFLCEASIARQILNGRSHYTAFVRDLTPTHSGAGTDPLDAIPLIAWRLDATGATLYANPALRTYAGTDELGAIDEVIGAENPATYREFARRAASADGTIEGKIRLRRASDGVPRWHLCHAEATDGCCIVVGTDIHDLKTADDELRRVKAALGPRD